MRQDGHSLEINVVTADEETWIARETAKCPHEFLVSGFMKDSGLVFLNFLTQS